MNGTFWDDHTALVVTQRGLSIQTFESLPEVQLLRIVFNPPLGVTVDCTLTEVFVEVHRHGLQYPVYVETEVDRALGSAEEIS